MEATEQYFTVVLFSILYKVVLSFESVDEILKCDHSNESYWAVLSCGAVHYALQVGSNFWVSGWNPKVWPFKWKLLSSTFLWYSLFCFTSWFYNFWVSRWNPKVWPFKWRVLSCTFLWYSLLHYTLWVALTFKPSGESRVRVWGLVHHFRFECVLSKNLLCSY